MPSFLKILRSTSLVMTVVCTWQPSSMGEAVESAAAVVVEEAEDGEGDEHLVGVQAGIAAVEHGYVGVLDGFDHLLRDELHLVVDAFYSIP